LIISLHTPKAGGSSFKKVLKKEFKNSFYADVRDRPINKSFNKRVKDVENFRNKFNFSYKLYYQLFNIKCIHGHFLPYKYSYYLDQSDAIFVTWLRDPLERLASHYYYWFRSYNKKKSSHLHRKVVEEKWTFDAFVFSTEMKNFYHQFLYKFPIENFNFIGITEYFDEDLNYFSQQYLNKKAGSIPKYNTNPNKNGSYFKNNSDMKNELMKFHDLDYEIYNYALQKRKKRSI